MINVDVLQLIELQNKLLALRLLARLQLERRFEVVVQLLLEIFIQLQRALAAVLVIIVIRFRIGVALDHRPGLAGFNRPIAASDDGRTLMLDAQNIVVDEPRRNEREVVVGVVSALHALGRPIANWITRLRASFRFILAAVLLVDFVVFLLQVEKLVVGILRYGLLHLTSHLRVDVEALD